MLLRKIWNAVSTALVVLVVILALLLVGARLVGLQVFTVLSGSMEPTYHTGALIYVKKVDPLTVQAGEVITFISERHRPCEGDRLRCPVRQQRGQPTGGKGLAF